VGVVGGVLYAVGGNNGDNSGLTTVEAYDPTSDTWTSKASMPTSRYALGVAVVNGILYAVGGHNTNIGSLATVEAYDPVSDTWTSKASMPTRVIDLPPSQSTAFFTHWEVNWMAALFIQQWRSTIR
jgi:hypothetical protein